MSFRAPAGLFWGYGIFGGTDDKLILSLGEGEHMLLDEQRASIFPWLCLLFATRWRHVHIQER